jgi:hypothetical protein
MFENEPSVTPLSELEDLARITPADIERAKAAWEKHAPPKMKNLLDAGLDPGQNCGGGQCGGAPRGREA